MSNCVSESIQVIALFNKFEHDLNELGVDYSATLLTSTGDYTPTSFHASNNPYTGHRMVSITTRPDDSVMIAECEQRTLSNAHAGEPYNPRLWTHQCTVHEFTNLKYNLQAAMLIREFDNLNNVLKGK